MFYICAMVVGLLAILVPSLVLYGVFRTIRLRGEGRLAVRRWAFLVFLGSIVLSCSAIVLIVLAGIVGRIAHSEAGPAPWILQAWVSYGWAFAFTWIVGLVIILRLRGVSFSDAGLRRRLLIGVALVMAPLSLVDVGACLAAGFMRGMVQEIAVAPSPDGRVRIRAYRQSWLDVTFSLESESNVQYPVMTRWLAGAGAGEDGFSWDMGTARLGWSNDSQVVALWIEGRPIVAYDFSVGESHDQYWFGKGARLDRLFADHGGQAQ
jgi:hypothetical protein